MLEKKQKAKTTFVSKFSAITLLLLCLQLSSYAQNTFKVTGVVNSKTTGLPLESVTVSVKNGSSNTTTDKNGQFSITAPNAKSSLLFSFIGYNIIEVPINNRKVITVTLTDSISTLEDLVVIGYGSQKRKDITGSVATVKMEDLQKAPVKSWDDAIGGRTAGVQATTSDGQPGSVASIIIRGGGSLTQDPSPLYVIDGFPVEANIANSVNPSDIESIEILKDASATAIYGARGANGVILITTKKGKVTAPIVNYDFYTGYQRRIKTIDVLNPSQFVNLQFELDSIRTKATYLMNGRTLDYYKNVEATDWQGAVFRDAPMSSHSISLRGGNEKTRYSISASALNQDGIFVNTGFKRYQGRIVLDQTISNKVKVGINANFSNYNSYGLGVAANATFAASTSFLYSLYGYKPFAVDSSVNLLDAVIDPTIDPTIDYRVNPYLDIKNAQINNITNNTLMNSYLEYKINNNLTLRITGGITSVATRAERFFNSQTRAGHPASSNGRGVNGSVTNQITSTWLNENTLTYNKKIDKNNNINAVVGFTQQENKFTLYGLSAIQLPNESLGLAGLSQGTPNPASSAQSHWGLLSWLGRVNYNFKNKYYLTTSFRADGSSKFMEGNRWGYFPSSSVAWRISNESFFKKNNFINDAKLRVGFGTTGNNRVGDFSFLSTLSQPITAFYSFNNGLPQAGTIPQSYGNPNLRWETTTTYNLGLDVELLKSKISITVDAYTRKTSDLLLNANLPTSTGYSTAFKNIGSLTNKGLEFTINSTNIKKKNFGWNTSFNISFNQNEINGLTQNQEALLTNVAWDLNYNNVPLYIAKLNSNVAQFYGYIADGVYQITDFDKTAAGRYILKNNVPTNGSARGNIQPGDIKYRDINGDNVVDAKDLTVIGRGNPLFIGGLTNNFNIGAFDFNIFFQFSYGNDIYNANKMVLEGTTFLGLNQYASYANRWSFENQNTNIPRVKGQGPLGMYSSRFVEDGSFLRLKTLAVGYTFESKLLKKMKLRSARLYASAQNIFTISKYTGDDPEVSVRNSTLTPGFDFSAYPRAFTAVFGLNVAF